MYQDDFEQIIADDETIPYTSSSKDVVTLTPFIRTQFSGDETSRCEKQTKIVYLKTHKVRAYKNVTSLCKYAFHSIVREQYTTKHIFSIWRKKQSDICATQCRWKSEPRRLENKTFG